MYKHACVYYTYMHILHTYIYIYAQLHTFLMRKLKTSGLSSMQSLLHKLWLTLAQVGSVVVKVSVMVNPVHEGYGCCEPEL